MSAAAVGAWQRVVDIRPRMSHLTERTSKYVLANLKSAQRFHKVQFKLEINRFEHYL